MPPSSCSENIHNSDSLSYTPFLADKPKNNRKALFVKQICSFEHYTIYNYFAALSRGAAALSLNTNNNRCY